MKIVHTFEDVRELAVGRVALVPTMGFFHEGHLSLMEVASESEETVVASIFVNQAQFNNPSDFDSYPRDFERDAFLAEAAGVAVLFAPDDATMFPADSATRVEVEGVASEMEGGARPGHFTGVATVVAKLLAGIQPDTAYFGRKDAQQLAVVRTMARDLCFPVTVKGHPLIREMEGLALSSRNVRLDHASRSTALALSNSLLHAADDFEAGERSVQHLVEAVRGHLRGRDRITVEYVEVATAQSAAVLPNFSSDRVVSQAFLAVAIRVGGVRLIDNVYLDPVAGVADRGAYLTASSILYGDT